MSAGSSPVSLAEVAISKSVKIMDSGCGHQPRYNVLMFPWLGYSHISSFLELSKRLIHRNFNVYFCSTLVTTDFIKQELSQNNKSLPIQVVELDLPSFPDQLQHPLHSPTNTGFFPQRSTLVKAFCEASHTFCNMLTSLKPDLLIHDLVPSWTPTVASSLNVPAVPFHTSSAIMQSYAKHFHKQSESDSSQDFPFPAIDHLREYEIEKLKVFLVQRRKEREKMREKYSNKPSSNIVLINTCREIEGKYIDYFSVLTDNKVVPVGPLVRDHDPIGEVSKSQLIMEWLDKKTQSSTVFVSFGSECFPSKEAIEEIAHGLELSMVNFLWVFTFPSEEKIGSIEDTFLEEFLERTRDRGLVVEGWAPQTRILKHSSIGGFVSHCGWGSSLESMKYGVPVIALPFQYDQPLNASLLEEIGVAIALKRDNRDGRFNREDVANAVKQVIAEKSGESVKERAKKLKETISCEEDKGVDEAVHELLKLIESFGQYK